MDPSRARSDQHDRIGRLLRRAPRRALRRAFLATALTIAALAGACGEAGDSGDRPPEPFASRAVIGGPGSGPGEFTIPRAIATDGRFLWIVDKSDRIQKFDPSTGKCLRWWHVPSCENGKPTGLTIAPAPPGIASPGELVLYVAHTHAHKILIYPLDADPKPPASAQDQSLFNPSMPPSEPPLLAEFGAFGRGPGEFIYPTDVGVLLAEDGKTVERLYVPEYGDHDRVSVFDPSFNFLFSFGTYGASAAPDNVQFDRPQSIEIDRPAGRLAIADARNHRIGVFTLDGALIRWIGAPESSGAAPGKLRYPWSLAILPDGSALTVEFGNNRLQRFDLSTGESLGVWGRAGRERGELAEPWALAVLGERTFVVESKNHRVQVMDTPAVAPRRRP